MAADSSAMLLPDPFALTPDPAVYLPRPATEAALADVLRSVNNSRTRTALIGPPGLGKTLMLHLIAVRAEDKFKTVYLPYAALPPEELSAWALNLLGAPETSDPVAVLCSSAKRLRERGFPLLLTVDDAGAMPVATARWMGDVLND
jgi:type II secretory pathway predicted ATPase ExeA